MIAAQKGALVSLFLSLPQADLLRQDFEELSQYNLLLQPNPVQRAADIVHDISS
jgi:hypothetical protein